MATSMSRGQRRSIGTNTATTLPPWTIQARSDPSASHQTHYLATSRPVVMMLLAMMLLGAAAMLALVSGLGTSLIFLGFFLDIRITGNPHANPTALLALVLLMVPMVMLPMVFAVMLLHSVVLSHIDWPPIRLAQCQGAAPD